MTAVETLNRTPRPYTEAIRDVIDQKLRVLAVTTHPHQRIALQDEIGRLRRILAEEEAAKS